MPSALAFALFVVAVAIGWWLGRRPFLSRSSASSKAALGERLRSMHGAFDGHSDDALARLSHGLEINADTLESHLHVGNLFRRRGDIEKALQIHQSLCGGAGDNVALDAQIRLELARDFMAAGLLGQAEQLLDELVRQEIEPASFDALDELRRISERERNWRQAIDLAERLVERRARLKPVLANYYCELAQERSLAGDWGSMRDLLHKAERSDPQSVRSVLMRLDCALGCADYAAAAELIDRVGSGTQGFIIEVVPILKRHDALAEPAILASLQRLGSRADASPAILGLLASLDGLGGANWRDRLLERVRQDPSWQGVVEYLHLAGDNCDPVPISRIYPAIVGLARSLPRYRCDNCGFPGQELHWHCPGCHAWNTLRPVTAPRQ